MVSSRIVEDGPVLYGIGEQETLHNSIEECIEHHYLNDYDPEGDPLPESVTVQMYKHIKPTLSIDSILEYTLEQLDDNHGNPEDEPTTPTDNMRHITDLFIMDICEEYQREGRLWYCQQIGTTDVLLKDYMEEDNND